MRKLGPILLGFVFIAVSLSAMNAQQQEPGKQAQQDYSDSPVVKRMMAFNKAKDGKLTKEELTDPRLHRLFEMADANKDGVVTHEELKAVAAKLDAEWGQGGGPGGGPGGGGPGGKGFKGGDKGGKGPGGPKGKGGPDDKGPPKGFGGKDGPPRLIGQILPTFIQEELNLSAEQRDKLSQLQKNVDAGLAAILTDQQKRQLDEIRERGPGGFGGPFGKAPPPK